MATRRTGAVLGLLLCGCLATAYFVYAMFSGSQRRNTDVELTRAADVAPPPARDPAPRPPPPEPARASPEPERPDNPPPAAAPERVPAPVAAPEVPDDRAAVPAELTLELVAEPDEDERRLLVVVADQGGVAVPGALVVFRLGHEILYRERTDASGAAAFYPHAAEKGPFRVDAVANGYLPATVAAAAPGATIDLQLKTRPYIEGTVKAPARGSGIVKLFLGEQVLETKIRADGSFIFAELDEGIATLQAEVPPYGSASEDLQLEGGYVYRPRLRIGGHSGTKIRGEIRFWPRKGSAWMNGTPIPVRPSGYYTFDRAVIGVNELVIDAPGKALFRERFIVRGVAKSAYNFRLYDDAPIRGTVRNERGLSVAGAEVRLGVNFDDPRNDRVPLFPVERVPLVRTGSDGRFEITRLDKRLIYHVGVVHPGYGQFLGDAVPGGGRLSIRLPEGPFVFGRLDGLGGVPRDAIVTAERVHDRAVTTSFRFNVDDWSGSSSGRDDKGFFGLSGLVPGFYRVRVDAPGYGSVETWLDLYDSGRVRVDLRMRRGGAGSDDEVELLRRLPPVIEAAQEPRVPLVGSAYLEVDATRPVGEVPFVGVRVSFFDGDVEMSPPLAFTGTRFTIAGLPPGTYRAVLTHDLLPKPIVRERVELVAGETGAVELR